MFTPTVCRKKGSGKKDLTKDRHIMFAINIRTNNAKNLRMYIPRMYHDRHGIETRYHVPEEARAKTSLRMAVHLFLIIFLLMLTNFWVSYKMWHMRRVLHKNCARAQLQFQYLMAVCIEHMQAHMTQAFAMRRYIRMVLAA